MLSVNKNMMMSDILHHADPPGDVQGITGNLDTVSQGHYRQRTAHAGQRALRLRRQ